MNPLLSVIIPVYNVGPWLRQALDSVIGQSCEKTELIVVNDGSTDESVAIFSDYKKKLPHLKVIHQQNRGLSAARNSGFAHALGEYLFFFDSDDILYPKAMSRMVEVCNHSRADLIRFNAIDFDDGSKPPDMPPIRADLNAEKTGQQLFVELLRDKKYASSVPFHLFRREFLQENSLSFMEGFLHEDEMFTPRAYLLANKALLLNETLYARRLRNDSITRSQPTTDHVRGNLKAVEVLLQFRDQHLQDSEATMALTRHCTVLFENAMRLLSIINYGNKSRYTVTEFIEKEQLRKLGMKAQMYAFCPRSYSLLLSIWIWLHQKAEAWTEK